jgi:AraC-like DNA-binding protein/quercetin dioxygenase-like cupin family protein
MGTMKKMRATDEPYNENWVSELDRLQWWWQQRVEAAEGAVVALPTEYPPGYQVPAHRHSRDQLLQALTGVVMVSTDQGRWMVPPEHAMWIPAGVEHSVEMLGEASIHSIYVTPDAIAGLPDGLRVVGLTDLARSLIVEAVTQAPATQPSSREGLILALLLHEIPRLPERPLGLPFPVEPRLVALCRRFVEAPSPHATIDEWAKTLAMSRRTFTRVFHRETGLSFSTWRQQACLFAALPRLAAGEPVTTVALDLGYESAAAFTTMFKRMLGTSPRSYLRDSG